ncbi:MAG: 5'-deoxyadenosine deaminase [Candidatus Muiribacteriota bacterium]
MILLKGGRVISFTNKDEFINDELDVLLENNKIKKIDKNIYPEKDCEVVDVSGKLIIPGFIQPHVHLCQVLFKGSADDMELLDWLKKRIWPLEAMHTDETIDISSKMGLCELISGGTTTIVDMGTVKHTDIIAENLIKSGIRAFFGKTMMDKCDLPDYIRENAKSSLDESVQLFKKYHNSGNERIKYAVSPRFAVSCSVDLMVQASEFANENKLIYHTHASENRKEVEIVKEAFGVRNIEFFEKYKIAGPNLLLAHCIWVDENEIDMIKDYGINVAHCPSANLKLASGIAPIPTYLNRKIKVGIGADGAPCNNNLSMFKEMKLAALIQKPIHGPTVMNAYEVFRMATLGGAETIGLEKEIGSIEEGKKADIVIMNLNLFNSSPYFDPVSSIVYSCSFSNIDTVIIDGKTIYKDKKFNTLETEGLVEKANEKLREMVGKL